MSKTLFQITDEMYQLMEYGCNADGEVAMTQEEFNMMYDKIELELTTKIDNTNGIIKTIDGEIAMIENEIKRLQGLKKNRETNQKWLKDRIDYVIRGQFTDESGVLDEDGLNKYKLQLPHSQISYRKSESVEIDLDAKLPKKYITVKIEEKPDKVSIKEALKNGQKVKGARLVKNINLQIK